MILNYLISHESVLYCDTSNDISDKIGVSVASISRFWSKIGYTNFKEFKKALGRSKRHNACIKGKALKKSQVTLLKLSPEIKLMMDPGERVFYLVFSVVGEGDN